MFEKNRFWLENEGQKVIGLSTKGRSELIGELDDAEKEIRGWKRNVMVYLNEKEKGVEEKVVLENEQLK
jgi:hypothetical protein